MKDLCKTNELWVGLDVSKASFDAAIFMKDAKCPHRKFQSTMDGAAEFMEWIAQHCKQMKLGAPQTRVIMESTGIYSLKLRATLIKAGLKTEPSIINPHQIKSFGDSLGVRNKTDKTDACVIARFGFERRPAPDQPMEGAWADLQELVRERAHLVSLRTAEKNRLKTCKGESKVLTKMREQRIADYTSQIKQIEAMMKKTVASDENLCRDYAILRSIPGVGPITAALVLGELGDLRRFKNSRQLAAYAGLSPRQHISGTSVHKASRMCRQGKRSVRTILFLSSMHYTRQNANNSLARYYKRKVAQGKAPMSALGSIMRKLLLLMRILLIENRTFQPDGPLPQTQLAA